MGGDDHGLDTVQGDAPALAPCRESQPGRDAARPRRSTAETQARRVFGFRMWAVKDSQINSKVLRDCSNRCL